MRLPARKTVPVFQSGHTTLAAFALGIGSIVGIIICLLCASPSPGRSSPANSTFGAQSITLPAYWDQDGVIADLDGDGRPDWAFVRQTGWGAAGVLYRIDLHLSTKLSASCIRVSGQRGGLKIMPRDVDADGDLDLVIAGAWSLGPLGVWINNGHGEFTGGDLTAYPKLTRAANAALSTYGRPPSLSAGILRSYKDSMGRPPVGGRFRRRTATDRVANPATAFQASQPASALRTRSPPFMTA